MSAGMVDVLPDEEMRNLGFHEDFAGVWFASFTVWNGIWLDFAIDKATGQYDELVSYAMTGQTEYYGRMIPATRNRYMDYINTIVAVLNAGGLALKVDHTSYGVGA
jgi:hypothetical protein